MEKKGILERLAAFWREDGPEMGGGSRRLWRNGRTRRQAAGNAEAGKLVPFWEAGEGTGFPLGRLFGGTEAAAGGTAERRLFQPDFRKTGKGLFSVETVQEQEKGAGGAQAFAAAGGRSQAGREARQVPIWAAGQAPGMEVPVPARAFLWEEPEDAGGRKKPAALAAGLRKSRAGAEAGESGTEGAAFLRQEAAPVPGKTEGRTAAGQAALPDIDGLMREMTRRLWEEREGCGRRMGG